LQLDFDDYFFLGSLIGTDALAFYGFENFHARFLTVWDIELVKKRRPLARPSSIKTNQQHETKSYRFLYLKSSLPFLLYCFTTALSAATPNPIIRAQSMRIETSMG